VTLTALELRLLATLLERRGRVQSRPSLLDDVWGMSGDVTTRTVDTHVKRLREKLGAAGPYIETVRGVGYRFTPAPDHAGAVATRGGRRRRAMKLNFRGKLFAVSFGLIALSLLRGRALLCGRRSRANMLDRIRADLYVRLALIAARRARAAGSRSRPLGRAGRRSRARAPRAHHRSSTPRNRDRRLRGRA
jgi:hypothetical protein